MTVPLRTYIPCPSCHDIGGRGYIEQWTLPDLPPFLVCEECNAAWEGQDDIDWRTGESFHMRAKRRGWDYDVADREAIRSELELFCVDEDDLREQVKRVLQHGHLVRPAEGPVHYRQLRLDTAIGCRGERVLIVLTAPHILAAFPSHEEAKADFHWW